MMLTEEQIDDLYFPVRNGIVHKSYHWPKGIIPYLMTSNHTKKQQDFIRKAMDMIEAVSCVKFIPRTNEKSYVQIRVGFK